MKEPKRIYLPLNEEKIISLKAGDKVYLTGKIYTARDRAHKRIIELKEDNLPFSLTNSTIYYCGPNYYHHKLGACGPTTASRMDKFFIPLVKRGVKATIGKGPRADIVREACKKYKAIYFITYAGCGAYLRQFIRRYKIVAFADLGPEAIFALEVKDFPVIVGIDSEGNKFTP